MKKIKKNTIFDIKPEKNGIRGVENIKVWYKLAQHETKHNTIQRTTKQAK